MERTGSVGAASYFSNWKKEMGFYKKKIGLSLEWQSDLFIKKYI